MLTDRPLERGALVMDDGSKLALEHGEGNWSKAKIHLEKDGSYHVAAIDGRDTVRITEDYFIEAKKDEPPSVKIAYPGRDPHVSPIEELPVSVQANDDFGPAQPGIALFREWRPGTDARRLCDRKTRKTQKGKPRFLWRTSSSPRVTWSASTQRLETREPLPRRILFSPKLNPST